MAAIPSIKPLGYPRPTDICDGCKGVIILNWGEKIKPHWKHKLCKELLIRFLLGGGILKFYTKCHKCTRKVS